MLLRELDQRIVDFDLKDFEMPFGNGTAIHLSLAEIPKRSDLASVAGYKRYLEARRKIPKALQDQIDI